METLVVNLFGGPGSGKSTMMAGVFARLKRAEINCEMATEFAKDLVWERSAHLLANQIWVFGQQHHRVDRLLGQVNVIVTDAPLLHSVVYGDPNSALPKLVWEAHNRLCNVNFFIKRTKGFVQAGRVHDEKQSRELDLRIKHLLGETQEGFMEFPGDLTGEERIASWVVETLSGPI